MYGTIARATQPMSTYEVVAREVKAATGGQPATGCVLHMAYPTDEGFTVIEVWEDQAAQQQFTTSVLDPAMQTCGFNRTTDLQWSEFTPQVVEVNQRQNA